MKTTKLAALVAMIALILFVALPSLSWAAEDGAALYKAKCAGCHKADGAGNPPKVPAVKGASEEMVKKAFGMAPHTMLAKNLAPAQQTAIADYLKSLK